MYSKERELESYPFRLSGLSVPLVLHVTTDKRRVPLFEKVVTGVLSVTFFIAFTGALLASGYYLYTAFFT